ncbi:MAG: PhoH family protein [Candidatus Weimeria sp.]
MVKTYILDTNIILNDPHSITGGFADNNVIITSTTLQELDSKKRMGGETGFNARQCGKILDNLRQKGDLVKGVKNESGGITKVEPDGVYKDLLPTGYSMELADNRIISACISIKKRQGSSRKPVILVTDDILMRISATAAFSYAGVKIGVEGYENSHIADKDTLYNGWCEINTDKETIDKFYKQKSLTADDIILVEKTDDDINEPVENEFFTFRADSQSALTVYRHGRFMLINPEQSIGWVRPKNELQTYAIWMLKNKDIPLKILIGSAGTGKTFLSLAAGLDGTLGTKKEGRIYDRILISRPITGFSEVGFMPGDLDEKLHYNNLSYIDNLERLAKHGEKEDREQIEMQVNDLFESKTIEVCGLSFIRGRSLSDSFLICDEAQNANSTLIRDVVTRAGEGTAVVLAGDPNQIDIGDLDRRNNGLEFAAARMKGSDKCAILRFPAEVSVRSPLAKEAAERMK